MRKTAGKGFPNHFTLLDQTPKPNPAPSLPQRTENSGSSAVAAAAANRRDPDSKRGGPFVPAIEVIHEVLSSLFFTFTSAGTKLGNGRGQDRRLRLAATQAQALLCPELATPPLASQGPIKQRSRARSNLNSDTLGQGRISLLNSLHSILSVQVKQNIQETPRTIWEGVDPVLVEPHGDGIHLCLPLRLLQLPPLLGQGALHHGCLGKGAVRVLQGKRGAGLCSSCRTALAPSPGTLCTHRALQCSS